MLSVRESLCFQCGNFEGMLSFVLLETDVAVERSSF